MVGVMGGKICCERGGHRLRFLRTWCVCLSWEAVSWSGVFLGGEGAVGLLGKEDAYKLLRNVLDLLNSLLFLP